MPFIALIHIRADQPTAEDMLTAPLPPGAQWVGLFSFPDRVEMKCRGNCVRKGSSAWRRDRMGFVKCGICGSRNRMVRRWLVSALFDFLGANLYEDAPAVFRTPDGYGSSRDVI